MISSNTLKKESFNRGRMKETIKTNHMEKLPEKVQAPPSDRSCLQTLSKSDSESVEGDAQTHCASVASDGNIVNNEQDNLPSPEEAKRETFRLASFKLRKTLIPPYQIAMAGFYHVGSGDIVKCFSCGTCVRSFNAKDDVFSATWHKTDCDFFLGNDAGNIKLGDAFDITPAVSPPSVHPNTPTSVHDISGHVDTYGFPPLPHTQSSHISDVLVSLSAINSKTQRELLGKLLLIKEEDRMKSFTNDWPFQLKHLVDSLAKDGFFFLGNCDRTQCFSCGAVLKNWMQGDNVHEIHKINFPNCRMVNYKEKKNVPISANEAYQPVDQLTTSLGNLNTAGHEGIQSSFPHMSSHLSSLHAASNFENTLHHNQYYNSGTSGVTTVKQSLPAYQLSWQAGREQLPSTSKNWPLYQPEEHRNSIDREGQIPVQLFNFDTNSKERSSSNLKRSSSQSEGYNNIEISEETFTSARSPNQGVKRQFQQSLPLLNHGTESIGENRLDEITRSPQTRLAERTTTNLLVDIGGSQEQTSNSQTFPFSPVMQSTEPPVLQNEELDVDDYVTGDDKLLLIDLYPCNEPCNRMMAFMRSRLNSFQEPWSGNSSISTVTEIAKAGFHYLGVQDIVRCWYCGVEAENWAAQSSAWEEHARLYPSCQYLLRNRGPSFVEAVLSQITEPEVEHEHEYAERELDQSSESDLDMWPVDQAWSGRFERGHVESGPAVLPTPNIVDPRGEAERKKLVFQQSMGSDMVQNCIVMGFDRNHVRKVVKKQIDECSCNYQTTDALVDALIAQEPDLIDLDSSDDEEEVSPGGISFEDVDDELELYQGEEESPVHTPPDILEEEQDQPRDVEDEEAHEPEGSQDPPERVEEANEEGRKKIQLELKRLRDEKRCKVCLDHDADMVFMPCGHICACLTCTRSLRQCPVCRAKMVKAYRTYPT